MGNQYKEIPLHRLNIPTETLRQSSSKAGDESLKKSLEMFGILSPLVVTELGGKGEKTEYAVWDGTRRTRLLRELNLPTTTILPCMVVDGDDRDSLVAQVNINNTRERLSEFAEAEALRQLVNDHGIKQVEAAGMLLKSKSWASEVMKVWTLPREVHSHLRNGLLALSHARIMTGYMDDPQILNMLFDQSISGNVSRQRLKTLGEQARKSGVKKALKKKPKTHKISDKTWFRIEPLRKGVRAELHLETKEEIKSAIAELEKQLTSFGM